MLFDVCVSLEQIITVRGGRQQFGIDFLVLQDRACGVAVPEFAEGWSRRGHGPLKWQPQQPLLNHHHIQALTILRRTII